jgi:hypothetical protein
MNPLPSQKQLMGVVVQQGVFLLDAQLCSGKAGEPAVHRQGTKIQHGGMAGAPVQRHLAVREYAEPKVLRDRCIECQVAHGEINPAQVRAQLHVGALQVEPGGGLCIGWGLAGILAEPASAKEGCLITGKWMGLQVPVPLLCDGIGLQPLVRHLVRLHLAVEPYDILNHLAGRQLLTEERPMPEQGCGFWIEEVKNSYDPGVSD